MTRTCWIIDNIGIARIVRHASKSPPLQIKDCGASRECPRCYYIIDNNDVTSEWPGLLAGVKFDPSDLELIRHLNAKCGIGNVEPHVFIDEFIPTLDGNQGFFDTHPENLPGAMKDGSSIHLFHKTVNAYATGKRKRRKIQAQPEKQAVRWQKTGRTKPVLENGIQKGCKKIMVLYYSSRKGFKPDKTNWVMHQYHLGTDDDEEEGHFVVSKIFYRRPKQTEYNDNNVVISDVDAKLQLLIPKTPSITICCCQHSLSLEGSHAKHEFNRMSSYDALPPTTIMGADSEVMGWLAGEPQPEAVEQFCLDDFDESLLWNEIIGSYTPLPSYIPSGFVGHEFKPAVNNNVSGGLADIENLELDSPPDFSLTGLNYGSQSQDSVFDGLDRL